MSWCRSFRSRPATRMDTALGSTTSSTTTTTTRCPSAARKRAACATPTVCRSAGVVPSVHKIHLGSQIGEAENTSSPTEMASTLAHRAATIGAKSSLRPVIMYSTKSSSGLPPAATWPRALSYRSTLRQTNSLFGYSCKSNPRVHRSRPRP
jgi:hypothetical protein